MPDRTDRMARDDCTCGARIVWKPSLSRHVPLLPRSRLADGLRRDSMMDRRTFLAGKGAVLIAAPLAVEGQPVRKVYRLGLLIPGVRVDASSPVTANVLPLVLRELGYVEGQNLVIERRFAEGNLDRLPGLARELVELCVDVLVAASTLSVRAAKDGTKTIPIVMLLSYSDPVALGLVASLARPGGNLTWLVMAAEPRVVAKRLELIKEAIPRAARIAFLSTSEAASRTQVQWAEKAASALGVTVVAIEVRDGDYDRAFATIVAKQADALSVVASVILSTGRQRIIQLAAKHRLPAIYEWREHVEEGGLMAYGGSVSAFARRAAVYVDRIFKGANPGELPVERATTFELVINLKTARALGLTIPPSLLGRADEVIQ